jgi:hypothetical protein
MQSFLIAALAIAILTAIFALQNTIPVLVTFMFWKFEGSLALVLMLTFALSTGKSPDAGSPPHPVPPAPRPIPRASRNQVLELQPPIMFGSRSSHAELRSCLA